MLILRKTNNVQDALNVLDRALRHALGKPLSQHQWKFPNGGGGDALPTWVCPTGKKLLMVGFEPDFRWRSLVNPKKYRCPILLALNGTINETVPTVEVNIPQDADRRVNGCFALDEDRQLWLCHRGSKMTVNQSQKIPKSVIHNHFKTALAPALDEFRRTEVIPVAALNPNSLQSDLLRFARQVEKIKRG